MYIKVTLGILSILITALCVYVFYDYKVIEVPLSPTIVQSEVYKGINSSIASINCQFYAKEKQIVNITKPIPYNRETYSSHLIDLVYLQNLGQGLINNEGWNRTKRLLEICKQKGAVAYRSDDGLFHKPIEYIASWFKGYGCDCEVTSNQVDVGYIGERVWIAVGIKIPDVPLENLVIIQTEQMTAPHWVERLRGNVVKCKDTKNCVIWEFSESNVRYAKVNYKTELPTMILPITLRRDIAPDTVNSINKRDFGYIFHGIPNGRRDAVVTKLNKFTNRWTDHTRLSEGYQRSILCISVHYYADDSGLELHRLAQHVQLGCFPLYETIGDPAAIELLKIHGTILFAPYSQFTETAADILKCVKNKPDIMILQQEYVRKWWIHELGAFEMVLKAFFDN